MSSPSPQPRTASPPDPACCPLCGQANRCAMEQEQASGQPQPPCWCTQIDFSAELLARVPAAAKDLSCICAACANGQKPG